MSEKTTTIPSSRLEEWGDLCVHMCQQGSPEWHELRRGVITMSRAGEVLSQPATSAERKEGRLGRAAHGYMLELLGEIVTGEPAPSPRVKPLEWGTKWEPRARQAYEEREKVTVEQVGFVSIFDGRFGCSPDGLIGDDGGMQIKCPYTTREHMEVLLTGRVPSQWVAQVQGELWVTGRQWWDYVSYDPRIEDPALAIAVVRVKRDKPYIEALVRACWRLRERLEEELAKLQERMGTVPVNEAHRIAHLLAPPIILKWGEETIAV